MVRKLAIKTTIEEIVDYWSKKVYEDNLSVDWSDAHERCWRCADKTNLERCHIIPHASGGEDTPSNLVLLCKRCHLENPNVVDTDIMWDWIKAYKTPFYDTFWIVQGFEEYKKMYHKDFIEQLQQFGITEFEQIKSLMREKIKDSILHFGDYHLNKATVAGILRMIYKDISKNNSD